MSIYKAQTGFYSFELVSTAERAENGIPCLEKCANNTLFISPSLTADIEVSGALHSFSDPALSVLAPLAAAEFMLDRRGLPLEEITVAFSGEIYLVSKTGKDGKIGIITEKCKQLYSNMPIFVEGTEIFISEYLFENVVIRIFESSSAVLVNKDALRLILYREEFGIADIAAAFSRAGEEVRISFETVGKKTVYPELVTALAALSAMSDKDDLQKVAVKSDFGQMRFLKTEKGIICMA